MKLVTPTEEKKQITIDRKYKLDVLHFDIIYV